MATMMVCPKCHGEIPEDCLHCDLCGEEILVCRECRKPGSTKFCLDDGQPLVPAKSVVLSAAASSPMEAWSPSLPEVSSAAVSEAAPAPDPAAGTVRVGRADPQTAGTSRPQLPRQSLRLINRNLGIDVLLEPGDELGRTVGRHVEVLAPLHDRGVSSVHAVVRFDRVRGWAIEDLDSTFGTDCRATGNWQESEIGKGPSLPIPLVNGWFLRLGYVEFLIRIESDGAAIRAGGSL